MYENPTITLELINYLKRQFPNELPDHYYGDEDIPEIIGQIYQQKVIAHLVSLYEEQQENLYNVLQVESS